MRDQIRGNVASAIHIAWFCFNAGQFILVPRLASGHPSSGCWRSSTCLSPRQDLCRLPSLPATVLSRSDCDWTGVSLSPLVYHMGAESRPAPEATVFAPRCRCGSWRIASCEMLNALPMGSYWLEGVFNC